MPRIEKTLLFLSSHKYRSCDRQTQSVANSSQYIEDLKIFLHICKMNLEELPEEILLTLLKYLQYQELTQLELVSKFFNNMIFYNRIYRAKYLKLPEINHLQYFDEWLEQSKHFHIRKMVSNFYKSRLHQYQNCRKIRGIYFDSVLCRLFFCTASKSSMHQPLMPLYRYFVQKFTPLFCTKIYIFFCCRWRESLCQVKAFFSMGHCASRLWQSENRIAGGKKVIGGPK